MLLSETLQSKQIKIRTIKVKKFIPITEERFLDPEEEFFETLNGKTTYIRKRNIWYTIRYNIVSNNNKFIIVE